MGAPRKWTTEGLAEATVLYHTGISQAAVAKRFGVCAGTIGHWMRKQGHATKRRSWPTGPNHAFWKGGRKKGSGGYISVRLLPADAAFRSMAVVSGKVRLVLEHRLVMAKYLGRPLTEHETVHHINGKKADNRLQNLQVRYGKHGKGEVFICGDCGSRNIQAATLA